MTLFRRYAVRTAFAVGLFVCLLAGFGEGVKAEALDRTEVSLYVGSTTSLKLVDRVDPAVKVRWKSGKTSVAKVSSAGKVTARKKGTATITATVNRVSYKCKVTVKDPYLSVSKLTLGVGETEQLTLTGAKVKAWKTSAKKIARVSSKGLITAVKKGSAKITCKAKNGKSYTCKVTVKTTPVKAVSTATSAATFAAQSGNPMFTGNANIDYMAEQMCKEAGVKDSMTPEERVKTLFYFVTHKFTHIEDNSLRVNYKPVYDLTALAPQIKAFKTSCDQLVAARKASYVDFRYCAEINYTDAGFATSHATYQKNTVEDWFNRRCGQCNRIADAFEILCHHVGVEAGICYGYYLNSNGTKSGHYWNWVKLDGVVYYYDVDVQLKNNMRGEEPRLTGYYYRWYKADKATALKHHEFKFGLQP